MGKHKTEINLLEKKAAVEVIIKLAHVEKE